MRRVRRQASGLLALSLIGSTAQPQHAGVKLAGEPSAWVTATSAFSPWPRLASAEAASSLAATTRSAHHGCVATNVM